MDSSFYTRVGDGKYEVHFETGEKWKYVLVETACRDAINHAKQFMVTENIVRCGECNMRIHICTYDDGSEHFQCTNDKSPCFFTPFIYFFWL